MKFAISPEIRQNPFNKNNHGRYICCMTTISDSELIHMIAAGGRDADYGFRELIKRYRTKIKSRLKSFGILAEELDDIFQDACIKLMAAASSYEDGSVNAWFTRIAKNTAIDHLRKTPRTGDVFVSNHFDSLKDMPSGAIVGISTISRQHMVAQTFPTLTIEPLSGDIASRLSKLDEGFYDAIIVGDEELRRAGEASRIERNKIFTDKTTHFSGESDDIEATPDSADIEDRYSENEVERCMRDALFAFKVAEPARCQALELQKDGYSINEISSVIQRSLAATKEFLSQSKKKLKPFIQHCFELLKNGE